MFEARTDQYGSRAVRRARQIRLRVLSSTRNALVLVLIYKGLLTSAAIFWSRGGRSRVESRGATPGFLARMYPTMTHIDRSEQKIGWSRLGNSQCHRPFTLDDQVYTSTLLYRGTAGVVASSPEA